MAGPRLEVLPDAEAAARRGAELIGAAARDAAQQRGSFSLAVSGGTEPWKMFGLLAGAEVDWDAVEIFQVDERIAPDGDEDRNLSHLLASLPEPAKPRVRPMPVTDDDPEAAATRYEALLPAELDLAHLGIGPDGHTASLVPGDAVLDVTDRRVAVTSGEYQGRRRMTLTYPTLAAARSVFWLITGEEKRDPLSKILAGDASIPAGRVEAQDALVIADEAAAP